MQLNILQRTEQPPSPTKNLAPNVNSAWVEKHWPRIYPVLKPAPLSMGAQNYPSVQTPGHIPKDSSFIGLGSSPDRVLL